MTTNQSNRPFVTHESLSELAGATGLKRYRNVCLRIHGILRSGVLRLLCLLVCFVFSIALRAQTGQGSIAGRVTDASGAIVGGTRVEVINAETQVALSTITNAEGAYNVQSLNPGQYTIRVMHQGFQTQVVDTVTVGAAQVATVNVLLKVGSTNISVTVNAQGTLLSTDIPDVTTTVDHEIVLNLPYPERSSLEAALLVPGVTGDPSVSGGIFSENPVITTGPVVPGASITVGGAAPGTSSILIDGSDVTQASYARTGINLSGQDVQETTVITSGISAKYGRTGGGVIVQASKPGTSEYHGALTWRHTDPFFNAYPLGSTAANSQHENFYGVYVGGPVWIPKVYNGRSKTFFFVGVEPARLSNVLGFRGSFDTPSDLAGQLHNSLALLNQTTLKNSGYGAALAAPRVGGIYTNSTVNAQGFPNGAVGSAPAHQTTGPSGLDDVSAQLAQNSFAKFVVSNLPSPTNPGPYIQFDNAQGTYANDGTNANYERGVVDRDNRYSFRIDHQINGTNQIYGRYSVIPISGPRFFALASNNPLTQVPTDTVNSHNAALGFTHIFSQNIVNAFRYSFLRVNQQRTPPASALSTDYAANYGLTPATLGKGFPSLGTLGTSTLQVGNVTPYGIIDQNFITGDDVTWTKGKHLFEFGGDFRWIQSNQYDYSALYGGKYSFSAQMTNTTATSGGVGGNALATLIMGEIFSYTAAPVSVPGYYRWRYDAVYFQDNWHVTPNLTLNMGLRYEVELPRREKFNNQALVVLNTSGTLNGLPTSSAFCFSGACGLGGSLWQTNWKGFEPRIGVSYAPTSRSTIRVSYGIMRLPLTGYEQTPDPDFNVSSQAVGNQSGGVTPNSIVSYITNPVGPLTSAYTALNGARGPLLSSVGLNPVYAAQTTAVPYSQNWSLTLQYEPTPRTLIQTTYQGLKGTHLIGAFTGSLNVPSIPTLVTAVHNQANLGANTPNPYGILQNGAVLTETNLQQLNPYQNFFNQSLPEIYPRRGASSYNAFYTSVTQRYGAGLSLLAYYTWSKTMDNVPDTNAGNSGDFGSAPPQDPSNSYTEWAVCSFDQPSRLKVGYVYELPVGTGKKYATHIGVIDQLIGNISTSGLFTMASGFPNYVVLGSTGYFTSFTPNGKNGCSVKSPNTYCASSALPTGYTLRPNIVPGVPLVNPHWRDNPFGLNGGNFTPYLNSAAFAVPGSLNNPALGNAPRTLPGARSPRETMFDVRVVKGFSFRERYKLNLTATLNNAFNHPVYFAANNTANDPLQTAVTPVTTGTTPSITFNQAATIFGHLNINSANLSRVIRVGAEFVF
jgi:Carboxypeptidase regulatory-like domain/TonB dependent receptor